MSKKILVTGGAGYVGSHACCTLKKQGYEPITFDHLKRGYKELVQFGPLIEGNLLDRDSIQAALQSHDIEGVMHFAAYAEVKESVEEPARYYENNVLGTLNLIHAMREANVNLLVFSSTAATYGTPTTSPIPDSHAQNPINPYGETKLLVEKMLKDFHQAYGLRSMSLRYFNAAGAEPNAKIGEAHQPESHLIPIILDVAQGKRDGFKVFGNDYDTPDGTCIRDYVHVTDLASAHVKAFEYLKEHSVCEGLNLSTNHGNSVLEVIEAAKKVTGKEIPYEIADRRAGDPNQLVGDASRSRELLNWAPEFTSIEDVVQTAWDWHQIKDEVITSKSNSPRN